MNSIHVTMINEDVTVFDASEADHYSISERGVLNVYADTNETNIVASYNVMGWLSVVVVPVAG